MSKDSKSAPVDTRSLLLSVATREIKEDKDNLAYLAKLHKNELDTIVDANGNTALHNASRLSDKDQAEVLLKAGASVNVRNNNGNTPLHLSAFDSFSTSEPVNSFRFLLNNGADVMAEDNDGNTVLHILAFGGYRAPFTGGAKPHLETIAQHKQLLNKQNKAGATPLHIAAMSGHIDAVSVLSNFGADFKIKNAYGMTALDIAMIWGHTEAAEMIAKKMGVELAKYVMPDKPVLAQRRAFTPVIVEEFTGVRNLRSKEAKASVNELLCCAVAAASEPLALWKMAKGGERSSLILRTDSAVNFFCPALIANEMFSAYHNSHKIYGAEFAMVSTHDEKNTTFKMVEDVRMSQVTSLIEEKDLAQGTIIQSLLCFDYSIMFPPFDNTSRYALESFRSFFAGILMWVNVKEMEPHILPVLQSFYNPTYIEELLAKGADINAPGKHSNTPLHIAAFFGCPAVVELLLAKGANRELKNSNGQTPLDVALANGNEHLRVCFEQKAAKTLAETSALRSSSSSSSTTILPEKGQRALNITFFDAIHKQEPLAVKEAIAKGAQANKVNERGNTPLHEAIFYTTSHTSCYKLVNALLKAPGIEINKTDEVGNTPLHTAMITEKMGIQTNSGVGKKANVVQLLIDKGADPSIARVAGARPIDLISNKTLKDEFIEILNNALIKAVEAGDNKRAKKFIFGGANVNAKVTIEGAGAQSAIEVARAKVGEEFAQTLIEMQKDRDALEKTKEYQERGLNQTAQAATETTAPEPLLTSASSNSSMSSVSTTTTTTLTSATEAPQQEPKIVLAHKLTPRTAEHKRFRTIMRPEVMQVGKDILAGAAHGEVSSNKTMPGTHWFEQVVEPNKAILNEIRDEDGNTPLHIAIRSSGAGLMGNAESLIKNGIDVNAVNNRGLTSLHMAAFIKTMDAVRLLLQSGANPAIVDHDGNTVLHFASFNGYAESIKAFIEAGIDINTANKAGAMPLHIAAMSGNIQAAELLISSGADLNAKNANGLTPLDIAIAWGHKSNSTDEDEMVELLAKKMGLDLAKLPTIKENVSLAQRTAFPDSVPTPYIDLASNVKSKAQKNDWVAKTRFEGEGSTLLHIAVTLAATPLLFWKLSSNTLQVEETLQPEPGTSYRQFCPVPVMQELHGDDSNKSSYEAMHQMAARDKSLLLERVYRKQLMDASHTELEILEAESKKLRRSAAIDVVMEAVKKDPETRKGTKELQAALCFDQSTFGQDSASPMFYMPKMLSFAQFDRIGAQVMPLLQSWSDTSYMEELLAGGADINIADANGNTPLHLAAFWGCPAVVEMLVARGADLTLRNKAGQTPLEVALANGNEHLRVCFERDKSKEKQADKVPTEVTVGRALTTSSSSSSAHTTTTSTALSIAQVTPLTPTTLRTRPSITHKLQPRAVTLEKEQLSEAEVGEVQGKFISFSDSMMGTQEDIAWVQKNKAILSDIRNKEGETLLHIAVRSNLAGDQSKIKALIANNIDINTRSNTGLTPLHIAAFYTAETNFDLLMEAGADPSIVDNDGNTALHFAAFNSRDKVIEALLEAGINVDQVNKAGATPLHIAAMSGNTRIAELLIRSGANLNAKNSNGLTPLDIARVWGYNADPGKPDQMVDLLAKKMGLDLANLPPLNENVSLVQRIAFPDRQLPARSGDVVDELRQAAAQKKWSVNAQFEEKGSSLLHCAVAAAAEPLLFWKLSNKEQGVDLVTLQPKPGTLLDQFCPTPVLCACANELTGQKDQPSLEALHQQGSRGKSHQIRGELRAQLEKAGTAQPEAYEQARKKVHSVPISTLTKFYESMGRTDEKYRELQCVQAALCFDEHVWKPVRLNLIGGSTYQERTALRTSVLTFSQFDQIGAQVMPLLQSWSDTSYMEELLAGGADINIADANGNTPLHLAAFWGCPAVVEMLVVKGADLTLRNKAGQTPLDVALANGNEHLRVCFEQKAAKVKQASSNSSKAVENIAVESVNSHEDSMKQIIDALVDTLNKERLDLIVKSEEELKSLHTEKEVNSKANEVSTQLYEMAQRHKQQLTNRIKELRENLSAPFNEKDAAQAEAMLDNEIHFKGKRFQIAWAQRVREISPEKTPKDPMQIPAESSPEGSDTDAANTEETDLDMILDSAFEELIALQQNSNSAAPSSSTSPGMELSLEEEEIFEDALQELRQEEEQDLQNNASSPNDEQELPSQGQVPPKANQILLKPKLNAEVKGQAKIGNITSLKLLKEAREAVDKQKPLDDNQRLTAFCDVLAGIMSREVVEAEYNPKASGAVRYNDKYKSAFAALLKEMLIAKPPQQSTGTAQAVKPPAAIDQSKKLAIQAYLQKGEHARLIADRALVGVGTTLLTAIASVGVGSVYGALNLGISAVGGALPIDDKDAFFTLEAESYQEAWEAIKELLTGNHQRFLDGLAAHNPLLIAVMIALSCGAIGFAVGIVDGVGKAHGKGGAKEMKEIWSHVLDEYVQQQEVAKQ
ncbi:MAG: ankyrin repeat domain-containing protein [Proteobacteria bacterium]|nr:ankyrin repeat domain-containing protein [Pseudomonadota bacterium]